MRQLSPLDAFFYYRESPTQYQHISSLTIYDQSTVPDALKQSNGEVLGFKDILRFMGRSLDFSPMSRAKIAPVPGNLDHPYWVLDENFDLEFHYRHLALPKPGDWQQLCIMIARLHSRPLDMTRPPWEVYVIEGLDNLPGLPKGCFGIFSKTHHAAIDGASGTHLVAATHTLEPDGELQTPEGIPEIELETQPSHEDLLFRTHYKNLMRSMDSVSVWKDYMTKVQEYQEKFYKGQVKLQVPAPASIFNGPVSSARVFEGRAFDLNDFKTIRKASPGATINDVVLTVVGGAIRKYVEKVAELGEESLIAYVPVNVRSEEQELTGGNVVAGTTTPVGTDIADPLKRLAAVSEAMLEAKEKLDPVEAREMLEYTGLTPAALAALGARAASYQVQLDPDTPQEFNMTVTNVPGVQMPIYLAGAKAIAIFGLGPISDGCGVFISAQSYNGVITLSITADREMMPDPALFGECLDAAFAELKAATISGDVQTAQPSNQVVNATVKRKREPAKPAVKSATKTAVASAAKPSSAKTPPASSNKKAATKAAARKGTASKASGASKTSPPKAKAVARKPAAKKASARKRQPTPSAAQFASDAKQTKAATTRTSTKPTAASRTRK